MLKRKLKEWRLEWWLLKQDIADILPALVTVAVVFALIWCAADMACENFPDTRGICEVFRD